MRILLLSLLLLSGLSHGQDLQDVIYKKDGSVLRGVLIEQDFNSGRYKIQLNGGSVFSVEKADIEKITKEAPLNGAANNGAININIENNPNINQSPNNEVHATAIANAPVQDETFKHAVFIGTFGKTFLNEDEDGEGYSGLNLAYRYNFNEHFAFLADINNGKLTEFIADGDRYDIPSSMGEVKIRQYQVAGTISTNNYQGWQFYTGLGLFKEKLSDSSDSITYDGTSLLFGLGYSWQTIQLQLNVAVNDSSDYSDDRSGSTANFRVGFNF